MKSKYMKLKNKLTFTEQYYDIKIFDKYIPYKMFLKYISIPVFLISLAVGLFVVYIYGTDLKPVYIYPTPHNVEKILFKDNADNCFKLKLTETKCPGEFTFETVKEIPVQI